MKIPETIEDVRANVAACGQGERFFRRHRHACLVTLPLNVSNFGDSYGFNPHNGELCAYDLANDERCMVHELSTPISALADAWDRTEWSYGSVSRDECLAFIDQYVKEHGDA